MATGSNFVGVVDVYPELSDYRVRCPHINKLEIKKIWQYVGDNQPVKSERVEQYWQSNQ